MAAKSNLQVFETAFAEWLNTPRMQNIARHERMKSLAEEFWLTNSFGQRLFGQLTHITMGGEPLPQVIRSAFMNTFACGYLRGLSEGMD